ncbi:glutathione S-transferase E14-like [Euwallacea fornicatus]|uniref:glutathione S-transferase E14-like n=1 Tax=Euwallacea fornicatus TaxID=995702 RepID=UPI00338F4E06
MGLKLYMVWGSPPVNAVLMVAKVLNLDLELKELDFAKQENLDDWYIKINPSHTVPALDDNGFILWDSHTILMYLVETYGKSSELHYLNSVEKFRVLQVLNLDCGTVFRRMSDCIRPLFYENQTSIGQKNIKDLREVYKILDKMLEDHKFLAGDRLTIADISVFSSVVIGNLFLAVEEYIHLNEWLLKIQKMDLYAACERGVEILRAALKAKISK